MYATVEETVRACWRAWGPEWAMFTSCHECGEMKHCRAKRKGGKWLCLSCWDLTAN